MRSIALSHASAPSRALSWPLPLAAKEPAAPPNDAKLLDLMKGADARRLFRLEQLEVSWDARAGALWTFMRPRGRPSYNPDFLEDFHAWQRGIVATFADRPDDPAYRRLESTLVSELDRAVTAAFARPFLLAAILALAALIPIALSRGKVSV